MGWNWSCFLRSVSFHLFSYLFVVTTCHSHTFFVCFRLPCAAVGAAEAIKNGDPPSEALQAIANAVETIKAVDNASTLEPPKSLCGRVMNVAVWEEPDLQFIKFALQVGSFIRLRNVHECRILSGLRCKFAREVLLVFFFMPCFLTPSARYRRGNFVKVLPDSVAERHV